MRTTKEFKSHTQDLPLGPENHPIQIDAGEQDAQGSQVDVALLGGRQDGLAGDQVGQQKQDRKKGVAAEDVADGKLVVPHLHGGEAGGEFRQGRSGGQDGGPEQDASQVDVAGDGVAGQFQGRAAARVIAEAAVNTKTVFPVLALSCFSFSCLSLSD